MNKLLLASLLVATGGLQNLQCYAAPTTPKPVVPQTISPKPEELTIVEGFQMFITAGSGAFAAGSPVRVSVSIVNVASKTNTIAASGSNADFHFEVKTAEGKLVPLTLFGQRMRDNAGVYFSGGPLEIAPGTSWDNQFILNQMYDMTLPGEYTVKISHYTDFKKFGSPKNPPEVTSNVLHITVT